MELIFCAEIGSNHKGNPALAFEMIRQAKLAGADIAKFQLGHPDDDPIRGMPNACVAELKQWCDYFDIEFMASMFSWRGLDMARKVKQKRYKLASRKAFAHHSELDYDEFLDTLITDGKEIFVSDGNVPNSPLVRPLWCITSYPAYPNEFVMPRVFDSYYGYSGHLHGYADTLIAIARGARYIEKHVTLDKTEESIKDNAFALSFEEFGEMVRIGRDMARLV